MTITHENMKVNYTVREYHVGGTFHNLFFELVGSGAVAYSQRSQVQVQAVV